MVHQVPAHLVAAVGRPGGEQQLGVLDRVRGQHHESGVGAALGDPGGMVVALVGPVLHAGGPAVAVDPDPGDHGPGHQGHRSAPPGLGPQRGVLRLGGADRHATGVPGAEVALQLVARVGQAVAGVRGADHPQRGRYLLGRVLHALAVQRVGQHLVQVAARDRPHRERVAVRERQADRLALLRDIGRHPDLALGGPVVRLQLGIVDRPVAAVPEVTGAEVLGVHARREPRPGQPGTAVGAQVAARVGQRTALHDVPVRAVAALGPAGQVQHTRRRRRRGRPVGRVRHLHRRRAVRLDRGPVPRRPLRFPLAGLQHQDPPALVAQPLGDQRPGEPGADHDHVPPPGLRRAHRDRSGSTVQLP